MELVQENFKSLGELSSYVEKKHRTTHGIIWRGQSDSEWGIQSSAFRLHQNGAESLSKELPVTEQDVFAWMEESGPTGFSYFLERLRSMPEHRQAMSSLLEKPIASLSEDEQNEVWALGQHHGLKTPLVDWSQSPYVALFFACADAVERNVLSGDRQVVIWGLLPGPVQSYLRKADPQSILKVFRPTLAFNSRILAQQGLFTRLTPDGDLVARILEARVPSARIPKLYKLTLPYSSVWTCLEHLYRMNIAYHTLYPDIEGLSRFANFTAANADYTGRSGGNFGFNVQQPAENENN